MRNLGLVVLAAAALACGSSTSTDATNDGGSTTGGAAGASSGAGGASAGKAGAASAGKAGAAGSTAGQGGAAAGQAGASAGTAGAAGAAAGQGGASGGTAGAAGMAGTKAGAAGAAAGQAGASGSAGTAGATGGAGGSAGTSGGAGTAGVAGNGGAGGAPQTPVRKIPGLESITFYETTGTTQSYTFAVDGPELSTKLSDPLSTGNHDIQGTGVEFYDVYYSDKDGGFQADGAYLTISGVFPVALPAGGGLNLAEISLNYTAGSKEFGNYVASFVALGDNAVPGDVMKAIDGDLMTWTTMGNTVGTNDRLRLTLGFFSSSGKP